MQLDLETYVTRIQNAETVIWQRRKTIIFSTYSVEKQWAGMAVASTDHESTLLFLQTSLVVVLLNVRLPAVFVYSPYFVARKALSLSINAAETQFRENFCLFFTLSIFRMIDSSHCRSVLRGSWGVSHPKPALHSSLAVHPSFGLLVWHLS